MEELIATYGYPVILLGTFFEGETIVLIAGYLASRDYLLLQWVIVAAFLGSWAGDSLYFFIGRRWGEKLLARRPQWRPAANRALDMLHRYHAVFILSFRFLYGLRTVSPFVIGMSRVSTPRFLVLNLIASVIWASVFSTLGFLLGTMLERLLSEVQRYELIVLGAIAFIGAIAWLIHFWRGRQRRSASLSGAALPAGVTERPEVDRDGR
jgi:membrane protein DedA with SNARE-associated domain